MHGKLASNGYICILYYLMDGNCFRRHLASRCYHPTPERVSAFPSRTSDLARAREKTKQFTSSRVAGCFRSEVDGSHMGGRVLASGSRWRFSIIIPRVRWKMRRAGGRWRSLLKQTSINTVGTVLFSP